MGRFFCRVSRRGESSVLLYIAIEGVVLWIVVRARELDEWRNKNEMEPLGGYTKSYKCRYGCRIRVIFLFFMYRE